LTYLFINWKTGRSFNFYLATEKQRGSL